MAEEQVIIDIQVSNEQATEAIKKASKELEQLRQKQIDLNKAYNSGSKSRADYVKEMKDLKKQMSENNAIIKANERVLQDNEKQMQKNGDSLKAMQSQLKEMIKEYSNLSKAERDGAKGTELLKKIDTQRQEVEKLEHALGDYRRQVGHYQLAVEGLGGPVGKAIGIFSKFSNGTMSVGAALKSAGTAALGFSKQLLKLLTNPFVALFAAIAGAVMKVVEAFKQNDTAMTNLQSLMASFKPILDIINGAFTLLASAIGNVVGKVSEAVQSITNAIPALRAFAKEEENIVRQRDALEEKQRQNQLASAKRMEEAARLYNKANDKINYTDEERIGFLKQYNAIMELDAKEKKRLLKEDLDLYEREVTLKRGWYVQVRYLNETQRKALNSEERKWYEQLIKTRDNYEKQLNDKSLASWQVQNVKAKLGETNRALQEFLKVGVKISQLTQKQYDELTDEEKQGYVDRQTALVQANTAYEEETRRSSARIVNMTIDMQKKETAAVVSATSDREKEEEKARKEQEQKDALYLQFKEQMTNDIINTEADAFEKERISIDKRYDDILKKARETYKSLGLTAEEWEAFEKAVNARRDSEIEASTNRELDTISKLKEQIDNISLNPTELTSEQELENLQMLKTELEQIYNSAMAAVEQNGTVEQYEKLLKVKQRMVEVNNQISQQEQNIQNAEKKQADMRVQNTVNILKSMQMVVGGLSGVFNALAEDNEKFQEYAKATAIVEATVAGLIASVQAIATATRSSATWVDMLVAVATVVASVGSVVGTIISQLKQTPTSKAPKFAEGGLVGGEFSNRTDDSVNAKLSVGESVINSKATMAAAPLLSAINQMYGGAPIGGGNSIGSTDAMREMMVDVMAEVRPVVSVKEITRVQNRVTAKETIAKN